MYCKVSNTIRGRGGRRRRSGTVLIWCGLALPSLVGMVGLVIDGGLMMATYRQAQNAADAAALVGANDLVQGFSTAKSTSDANTFLATNYNVTSGTYSPSSGTGTINIPPKLSVSYSGSANYVEAVVSLPLSTYFIQVLPGISQSQSVTAHAVAGFEGNDAGAVALDPSAKPAISLTGNGSLDVKNGNVLISSSASPALKATGNGSVDAAAIKVVGTAQTSGNGSFQNLQSGSAPIPDPFVHIPTPTTANGVTGGTIATPPGDTSGNYTPGVYTNGINYSGKGAVTLAPGIYVLPGNKATVNFGKASSVTGSGVMFYVTGANYDPSTGVPDNADPLDPWNLSPPGNTGTSFPNLSWDFSAGMTLTGIDTTQYSYANSAIKVFNGMLFYYRRADAANISLTGPSSTGTSSGTLYAKWGSVSLTGNGSLGLQFVVDTVTITGNGSITINYAGSKVSNTTVYLVD